MFCVHVVVICWGLWRNVHIVSCPSCDYMLGNVAKAQISLCPCCGDIRVNMAENPYSFESMLWSYVRECGGRFIQFRVHVVVLC